MENNTCLIHDVIIDICPVCGKPIHTTNAFIQSIDGNIYHLGCYIKRMSDWFDYITDTTTYEQCYGRIKEYEGRNKNISHKLYIQP